MIAQPPVFKTAVGASDFRKATRGFIILCLVIGGLFNPLAVVLAASRSDFQAAIVSLDAPAQVAPGARAEAIITLKNTGKAAWTRDGGQFVSLYNYDAARKIETPSSLASGWENGERVGRVVTKILPQGVATFRIPLKAPSNPGAYHAEFVLVAENLARMSGSRFGFDLTVSAGAQPSAQSSASVSPPTTPSVIQPSGNGQWRAELVTKGGNEWQIDLEKNIFVTAIFKNIGTQVWRRDGASYLSVYATEGTKERVSPFRSALWNGNQAGKLQETEVKPGGTGTFRFEIRAPATPGRFVETFTLAAEDTAWLEGGSFQLPVNVPMTSEYIAAQVSQGAKSDVNTMSSLQMSKNSGYGASLFLRSASEVKVAGNGSMELQLGFKNVGTAPWSSRGLKIAGVQGATVGLVSFRDPSWVDSSTPVSINGVTKPGEIGFVTFKVKGPAKKGTYTASFQLNADGFPVDGGYVDIPVTVTSDGYIEPEPTPKITPAPVSSNNDAPASSSGVNFVLNPQPLSGSEADLQAEPLIRVGLYKTTDNRMVIRAKYAPVSIQLNGREVCRLSVGEQASAQYDFGTRLYTLAGVPCNGQSAGIYKFLAEDGASPMEIADYSRPISWLPGANDNTFRRSLELMYVPSKDSVWVVNELPIESYLKGIAETSNSSPQQYQRSLLVAARTYAVYHVNRNTKHGGSFNVDSQLDQVYRGYGAESRGGNIVAAVETTRGQIVTYDGKLAITPYFSRSDGRTRSWSEVWAGSYPWLVSVSVPQDAGKTLWGHGVGMSATGALQMDAKDGMNYQQILSHFYRGTELRKAYR